MTWYPITGLEGSDGAVFQTGVARYRANGQWVEPTAIKIQGPFIPVNTGARFYGDPGIGNVIIGASPDFRTFGASNGYTPAIQAANARLSDPLAYAPDPNLWDAGVPVQPRKWGMIRSFSASNCAWETGKLDAAIANGAIPWQSFKGVPATVLAGGYDLQLRNMVVQANNRLPWPIYWTYIHEPEDEIARGEFTAYEYRQASRYIKQFFDAEGATNLTFVPTVYMLHYTWNTPGSGRNPWAYHPDLIGNPAGLSTPSWNPSPSDFYTGVNAVTDVLGLDHYTQWRPSAGKAQYLSRWKSRFDQFYQRYTQYSPEVKPFAIGETVWPVYSSDGGNYTQDSITGWDYDVTAQFMRELYPFFAQRGIVAFTYYDTTGDSNGQPVAFNQTLAAYDAPYSRFQLFAEWLDKPTTLTFEEL